MAEPLRMRGVPDAAAAERIKLDRDAVRDLVQNHRGWEVLVREAERRMESIRGEVLSGRLVGEHADRYASYTGQLQGITWILNAARQLADTGQAEEAPSNGDT